MKKTKITTGNKSSHKHEIDLRKAVGLKYEKRLTIDISEELHTKLKAKAALEKTRMADVVRKALNEYVS